MSRSGRWAVWASLLALVAAAAGALYLSAPRGEANGLAEEAVGPAEPAAEAVPVDVVEAIRGTAVRTLATSSTLEAERQAAVLAKVGGVVTDVAVREGEPVAAGALLARIEDEERRLALERAELRLQRAETELQRATLSFEQQLISRFDYDKAVFDRNLADAEKRTAELELRHTEVRAPFAGRITDKAVVAGRAIQPGERLFTLADFGTLVARLYLPEKDVVRLAPGQAVTLVSEAAGGVRIAGRVRDIGAVVDPATGTVKVTVAVVDGEASVRPGAFVRAEIETDRHEDAVLVPKRAVVAKEGREVVFVAAAGRAERRTVRSGYAREAAVEILDGVAAGEKVIVAGHTALEDGARIEIRAAP